MMHQAEEDENFMDWLAAVRLLAGIFHYCHETPQESRYCNISRAYFRQSSSQTETEHGDLE